MFTARRAFLALPRPAARCPRIRASMPRLVQPSQSAFYATETAAEQISTNSEPVEVPTSSTESVTETSPSASSSSTTPEPQNSSSDSSPSVTESTAPASAPKSSQNHRKPFDKNQYPQKNPFAPKPGATASNGNASNQKPASSAPPQTEVKQQAGTPKAVDVQNPAEAQHTKFPPPFIQSGHNKREQQNASLDVDWSTSFHGVSTKAVTETQYKTLMAPINTKDVEVKPDGIIYLPEIKYRRKMNETFGPMGWGLVPRGEPVVGQTVVTREFALVVDGRFVSQSQGENQYFSTEQLPSAVEGCKSNALMRCCKDLGVASELWDPKFIRSFRKQHVDTVWVEHATTKKKRQLHFRKGEVEVAYPWKKASA